MARGLNASAPLESTPARFYHQTEKPPFRSFDAVDQSPFEHHRRPLLPTTCGTGDGKKQQGRYGLSRTGHDVYTTCVIARAFLSFFPLFAGALERGRVVAIPSAPAGGQAS